MDATELRLTTPVGKSLPPLLEVLDARQLARGGRIVREIVEVLDLDPSKFYEDDGSTGEYFPHWHVYQPNDLMNKVDKATWLLHGLGKVLKLFSNEQEARAFWIRGTDMPWTRLTRLRHVGRFVSMDYVPMSRNFAVVQPDSRALRLLFEQMRSVWKIVPRTWEFTQATWMFYRHRAVQRDVPLMSRIDWARVHDMASPVLGWHGDFSFENILCVRNEPFAFCDWRPEYGHNGYAIGDLYYELGKLRKSFFFDHRFVHNCTLDVLCPRPNLAQLEAQLSVECEKLGVTQQHVCYMTGVVMAFMARVHVQDKIPGRSYTLGQCLAREADRQLERAR